MVAIVIPARMASTRFPDKPLCDLMGKPMIQWVYEAALNAQVADAVLIATPDQKIADACKTFGAAFQMTGDHHQSGTDRISEAVSDLGFDVIVNVQGDEPLIQPATIRACALPLVEDPNLQMSSIWTPCEANEIQNPAVVKVVTDLQGYALYFSRSPIPFERNTRESPSKKHVGIYGYRRSTLLEFSKWPVSELETIEGLEQLRFLEHGVKIKMAEGQGAGQAVDLPEQADLVRAYLAALK